VIQKYYKSSFWVFISVFFVLLIKITGWADCNRKKSNIAVSSHFTDTYFDKQGELMSIINISNN